MIRLITAIILNFTRAKYRVTQSIPLVTGTIHYTPYDFKMVAMYQMNETGEYVSIDKVPTSGYALNTEESYCIVDGKKDDDIFIFMKMGKCILALILKERNVHCILMNKIFC